MECRVTHYLGRWVDPDSITLDADGYAPSLSTYNERCENAGRVWRAAAEALVQAYLARETLMACGMTNTEACAEVGWDRLGRIELAAYTQCLALAAPEDKEAIRIERARALDVPIKGWATTDYSMSER